MASVLAEKGMRTSDIDELLAPAWELHEDPFAWHYMSNGLALFVRPGWHRAFRVPVEVPAVATVGDRSFATTFTRCTPCSWRSPKGSWTQPARESWIATDGMRLQEP